MTKPERRNERLRPGPLQTAGTLHRLLRLHLEPPAPTRGGARRAAAVRESRSTALIFSSFVIRASSFFRHSDFRHSSFTILYPFCWFFDLVPGDQHGADYRDKKDESNHLDAHDVVDEQRFSE